MLENAIARSVALSTSQVLGPEDVAMAPDPRSSLAAIVGRGGNGALSSPYDRLLDLCANAKEGSKGRGLVVKLKDEVALKQTAIVVVSLDPLDEVPSGKPLLELVVKTGARETDRKTVRLP